MKTTIEVTHEIRALSLYKDKLGRFWQYPTKQGTAKLLQPTMVKYKPYYRVKGKLYSEYYLNRACTRAVQVISY